MATVFKEPASERRESVKEKITRLERENKLGKYIDHTEANSKEWKFPAKWKRSMKKSTKRGAEDKVLMLFLNIKGEIEAPRLIPLYSGNIIIWKHKAYEFDPRASWIIHQGRKTVKIVIIREIDRRPVSNLDWDEVKKRGDATDSDEILIKMVKKAMIEKAKTQLNKGMIIVVVILIIAAIVFFLFFNKGG